MITLPELQERLATVKQEREQAIMQLGAYNGVVGELERQIASFDSQDEQDDKNQTKDKKEN